MVPALGAATWPTPDRKAHSRWRCGAAVAWGQAGLRLNTVGPSAVETPLLQAGLADPRYGQAIKNFLAPIPRLARPDEVAAMIVYLMGPQAGFIHGAQFFIDGGVDAMARPTQF